MEVSHYLRLKQDLVVFLDDLQYWLDLWFVVLRYGFLITGNGWFRAPLLFCYAGSPLLQRRREAFDGSVHGPVHGPYDCYFDGVICCSADIFLLLHVYISGVIARVDRIIR